MAERSIAASDAGIEKAEIALTDKGWSRQDLADRVVMGEAKSLKIGIDTQTVDKFLTQKCVSRQYFVAICKALGLDWQEIREPKGTPSPQKSLPNDNPIAELEQLNINHNNPFIPQHGKIDEPRFFFGREREIRWVFQTLNSGSSVAIIGERAIGKSSVLQAIYREAPNQLRPPRQPIYLDLKNVCDENDFYGGFMPQSGYRYSEGIFTTTGFRIAPSLLLLLDEVEKMTWDGFTNQSTRSIEGFSRGNIASLRLVIAAAPLSIPVS
jgi:hypothetical protein